MRLLSAVLRWSLANRPAVVLAALLVVVFGVRAGSQLPIDAVPDITNIQVQVVTAAPALSPVEVEKYVSIPVERAMQGLPKVAQVRSLSKYGMSIVTVVFDDDTDIYFARQLVAERMPAAKEAVVAGYGVPEMGPITTGLGEIYQFTVRNDSMSMMDLEELLDWYIGPQLATVPGVVEVNSLGGEDREYQIVIDSPRLQSMGLSIRDVVDAIERSNANAGGGYIERDREHVVVGTEGLVTSLDDLRSVVLGATPQGAPITVDQIGEVRFGPRIRRGAASMDAEGEVVVGLALMLMGENPREVTAAVKRKLAELQPSLPEGTRIDPFYDRSRLVDRTITTAATNLAEGAALVILVLLLLLGDLRAGFVVALVIPLSMLLALIAMRAVGISGNLMSLGAIDFGLIVDGAVIVVENAARRLAEAQRDQPEPLSPARRVEIVRDATLEVRRATVYGEIIIAVVYIPILTLTGVEGKLFTPMASTVLFAIGGAFVLSLTLVPVLASLLLRPRADHRPTRLMRLLQAAYRPVLGWICRHKKASVALGLVALVAAGGVATRLGAEFVPQLDEGDILVEAQRLPGVALTEAVEQDRRIQAALLPIPEVQHVVSKTGSPELAIDPMGLGQTDVFVSLIPNDQWRPGLTKDALAREISAAVEAAVPEVVGSISQPIQMRTNELVAGVRSDVGVLVYGPDLDALVRIGDEVLAALQGIEGVVDARAEQVAGLGYLRVIPDRPQLARYGLTVADVNLAVESIGAGHSPGFVLEEDRRFTIRVKVRLDPAASLEAIARLPLRSMTGHIVPLGDVAQVRLEKGPAVINRESQSRRLVVEFNVRERDLTSTVAEARAAIEDEVDLEDGYRLEWGGTFQHYEEATARLRVIVPIALALIVFLLWSAFGSLRLGLIIFLNVPFAVVGGVLALWLRDIPFSISAGIGFIALFGVAVLNGLVLVTVSRHLEGRGVPPAEAIRQAADQRLRPVLTTALVASLGFVPMALSTAPGSEVQRPLATVVIGGLITATLLTLFLLPAIYGLVRRAGAPETFEGG